MRLTLRTLVVLPTLAFAPVSVSSVSAQTYGLMLGAGGTTWSGTASEGWSTRPGLTSAAFTVTLPAGGAWAGRLEIGGRGLTADLGSTGIFGQETRVTLNRVVIRALVRPSLGNFGPGLRAFAEGGLAGWSTSACDIDLEGGPGFLGGETEVCSEWLQDDAPGPLIDKGSGVSWIVGGGIRLDRWAFGMRYERDFADAIGMPLGAVRPAAFEITGEWILPWGEVSPGTPGGASATPESAAGSGAPDAEDRRAGRVADAVLAGAMEAGIPFLGYAYAGAWSSWEAFLSNATRVAGVMVLMTGQGDGAAVTGGVLLGAGTVWAVTGAARRALHRGRL